MSLIQLRVNRITYSQNQSGAYAMILDEVDGKRKLPVVIGEFEAQSIAVNLDKDIKPQRPFTHDLFKNFAYRFDIAIKRVIITKLVDGVFYSSLICERDKIEEIIDSRTSDAVSLALRFKAPIYTHESVLEKAGVVFEKGELPAQGTPDDELSDELNYSDLSNQELENAIKKAVKKEDYELAARLRDEISKRTNKTKE
ncbi:bifunctional nuclease family protein [Flavobacteriaceae bacterium]|jgi:bifunctional DNase/RNase|nr:bifunctional nuclease family protein [Flavobacteriaceae bacterium]